jgi:hypothetical protein
VSDLHDLATLQPSTVFTRYINMDYVFFSTMRQQNSELTNLVVSYDIGCQWSRNFWTRMKLFPHEYHIDRDLVKVKFLVPKFHLPAHRPSCQSSYSFNYTPHVGRTDGEAPERGWSNTNALSSSTKEMGPGSRRDTLDDHFGDMNWKKVCGLGLLIILLLFTKAFTYSQVSHYSGKSKQLFQSGRNSCNCFRN